MVPVFKCKEPPKERLLRCLDMAFLKVLKENMLDDPYGPGVPTVALLCTNVKSVQEFEVCHIICVCMYGRNIRSYVISHIICRKDAKTCLAMKLLVDYTLLLPVNSLCLKMKHFPLLKLQSMLAYPMMKPSTWLKGTT